MPANIYHKIKFIQKDGLYITHPWFLMIDYFRMFTDPMLSYWRLEKTLNRYLKLQKTYPLPTINKPLAIASYKNVNLNKSMDLLFDFFATNPGVLFTGFYTYNYYLWASDYNKQNKQYDYTTIPYYEVYSTNYIADGIALLEFIKSMPEELAKNISHNENYPFFQLYGYNTVIYYNDGQDNIPILYLYSNNKRSIPFKSVDYVKFTGKNIMVDNKKQINIGSVEHNILHGLNILVKIRVDDDNDWNDIIYKYINGIVLFRNYFLSKHKLTIYDPSIFQGFVIECIGQTIQPEREKRLQMDAKRKKGKPVLFRYDPSVSKTPPKFIFANSSGNPIIKDAYLQLLEKNLNPNAEQEDDTEVDEVEPEYNKEVEVVEEVEISYE
jgi:hypothetical protein